MSEPAPYTGTLSVTLHEARSLASANVHHAMSPIATIQLPHCSHVFATPASHSADTHPVWNAEFDLNLHCQPSDLISLSVYADDRRRDLLGSLRLSLADLRKAARRDPERRGRWFKLDRDGVAAGELLMSMEWKGKGGEEEREKRRRARAEVQEGRFVISDDESSEDSASSEELSPDEEDGARHPPIANRSGSGSDGSRESISGTASTEDGSSGGSGTGPTAGSPAYSPSLASPHLADRRSSAVDSPLTSTGSTPSPASTITGSNSSPSISSLADSPLSSPFPPPDDSYNLHADRHISSFVPSLSLHGHPPLHSSGRHGLLYDDTSSFDDRNFLQANASLSSLCVIKVWSRDYIHGLQLTYSINGEHVTTPPYLGKVHTTEHVLKLHHSDGEYVIGVQGTYKEWLETLTVITNRRSHTFGGNVDKRIEKWAPAGSKTKATAFKCEVPAGHRVVGFEGGYGVHLHNLGVFHQPISEVDGKRKKCSIVGALRKKFSNSRLDTLREATASPRYGNAQ